MILYFTGTGNSAYTADCIKAELQDEVRNLFDSIRRKSFEVLHSHRSWVIVTPTYAWRIPRVVEEWLRRTTLTGNQSIYFVMTCGGSIGNAGAYLEALCHEKQLEYKGCFAVKMPENYIALYDAPEDMQARQIIAAAQPAMKEAARYIQEGKCFPHARLQIRDRVNSTLINPLFYPLIVHARRFYATDACIACHTCERVCPMGNIQLKQGKPVWGNACTHCMACICTCPKEAIEYGKSSQGKVRYLCSRVIPEE